MGGQVRPRGTRTRYRPILLWDADGLRGPDALGYAAAPRSARGPDPQALTFAVEHKASDIHRRRRGAGRADRRWSAVDLERLDADDASASPTRS